jgi:hypothetical protein
MMQYDAGQSRSPGSPSDDDDEAAEAKRRRVQVGHGMVATLPATPQLQANAFYGFRGSAASM